MALPVWVSGCCPCQSLTSWCYLQGDVVCLTACFMDRFIHWILELTGLLYVCRLNLVLREEC